MSEEDLKARAHDIALFEFEGATNVGIGGSDTGWDRGAYLGFEKGFEAGWRATHD